MTIHKKVSFINPKKLVLDQKLKSFSQHASSTPLILTRIPIIAYKQTLLMSINSGRSDMYRTDMCSDQPDMVVFSIWRVFGF